MSRIRLRVRGRWVVAAALVAAALTGVVLAGATLERASLWRGDRELVVDGQDADWQGITMPVKGEHFSLGIVNDGEYLYFCLPAKDAATRSVIASRGLIVWLDKGGKKNKFGIHFPIDQRPDRRAPAPRDDQQKGDARDAEPPRGQDFVAILGPGSRDAKVVPLGRSGGIEARIDVRGDLLVYELKVPLKRDEAHPYAPDVAAGDTIRVELGTPSIPGGRAPLGRLPGGVVIVGGGGPRVGGGVNIGVGGPPFGSPALLEGIDVVMNVRLASGTEK